MIIKKKDGLNIESAAEIMPDWDKNPISAIHKNRRPLIDSTKVSEDQKDRAKETKY